MKKCVFLILALFYFVDLSAQNFTMNGIESDADLLSTVLTLTVYSNKVGYVLKSKDGKESKKDEKIIGYKEIYKDGLLYFRFSEKFPEVITGQKDPPSDDMLVLAGKIIREDKTNNVYPDGKILVFAETAGFEKVKWCFVTPSPSFNDHVGRIYTDCTSYLKEKNKEYTVDNLCNCKPGTPWVEGVPGDGNGEGFTIYNTGKNSTNSFYRDYKYLLIMNGYISYEKPYLYKQNNRIKKIKVTGVKSGKSKILDVLDTPHPQTVDISFITEPEDIRVEIADVYKGTKYDDTCINFCVTYSDKVIPYENSVR